MGKNEKRLLRTLKVAFSIFIFFFSSLFSADFDCIVIGSSPFSLFEALYQTHSGKRVLILEESDKCGGAWQSIDVCGITHADLGCHLVGNNLELKSFIEKYAGCQTVSMDNPLVPYNGTNGPNGWYFSRGCYELIENLLKLIEKTDITLLTSARAEKVFVDPIQKTAIVETKRGSYTTSKLILTPMSQLDFALTDYPQNYTKMKHYHLYLVIDDPNLPKFSYYGGIVNGISRMMNLTHFVGLYGTGKQFIVIQTYNEHSLNDPQMFLDALKQSQLIDPNAYIIANDTYIYESGVFYQGLIAQVKGEGIIEILQTGVFGNLSQYIPKWETVLKPYWNILTNQE